MREQYGKSIPACNEFGSSNFNRFPSAILSSCLIEHFYNILMLCSRVLMQYYAKLQIHQKMYQKPKFRFLSNNWF